MAALKDKYRNEPPPKKKQNHILIACLGYTQDESKLQLYFFPVSNLFGELW